MIDQIFPPQLPAPTKAKPSATIEYVNGGVKFNNKFYTEAEFAKYIEKTLSLIRKSNFMWTRQERLSLILKQG